MLDSMPLSSLMALQCNLCLVVWLFEEFSYSRYCDFIQQKGFFFLKFYYYYLFPFWVLLLNSLFSMFSKVDEKLGLNLVDASCMHYVCDTILCHGWPIECFLVTVSQFSVASFSMSFFLSFFVLKQIAFKHFVILSLGKSFWFCLCTAHEIGQ